MVKLLVSVLVAMLVVVGITQRPEAASTPVTSDKVSDARYQKPHENVLKSRLTRLQYDVTQRDATERPYANDYWDNKKAGIYVDVVSGEPLFSSQDKYDSKTGWPSFTRPIDDAFIVENTDYKMIFPRTEVRSKYADSHLGHVFKDGPVPTRLRYCINSASLRFVASQNLVAEGYAEYARLFD